METRCTVCRQAIGHTEGFFCYWCGRFVCPGCVQRVLLPLASEATVCPACAEKSVKDETADEAMMEIMVNAAAEGHDLTAWVLTEDGAGWQARCRRCQGMVWVGMSGVQYSLLAATCWGEGQ